LFRRYTLTLALLLSIALLASGGSGAYFAYQDTRVLVDDLQREKARAAADRIGQFMRTIEVQMRGALVTGQTGGAPDIDARHAELLRLLRLVPAITEAAWLDAGGRERIRAARIGLDVVGSGVDRSTNAAVVAARSRGSALGTVYFHRGSEPHVEMAVTGTRADEGIVLVDVNLKFAADVVAEIRLGAHGYAYVVDAGGRLILHPDASAMLRMTDLSARPQVQAALGSIGAPVLLADGDGERVIATYAVVEPAGWRVIVEQPLGEALAPMFASLARSAIVLLVGIVLALAVSLALARRMTAPIRALELGAQRIGEGRLDERVGVRTGDELESLAEQFNRMARQLRDSYVGLEQQVEERTRQLDEANRAKGRFLAAASHDLRQPVHALGLFVAQLEEASDEVARRRLISRVAASSAAVADLLDALLDISKLDAGAVVPQPTVFALQPLFDRVEHAFALAAAQKGLRLRIRPTALRVHTDPVLLERIVDNLCANAIRYTEQGGAIVAARRRGECVRIEVRDTGIGIVPEQQRQIFAEFYQVTQSRDLGGRGLGLGLAIVERLCVLLGLPLDLRSAPGRGSVFSIDVTLAAAPSREAVPAPGGARFDALPVLLIDDDSLAREAIGGLLSQWGCEVHSAGNGEEAMQAISQMTAPRLIICDYHLNDRELGTQLVARLRSAVRCDTPAVILSADASHSVREEAAEAGLHLLHKPLNPARLRALMLHVAGGSDGGAA